jgi:hypothetical protein
MMVWYGAENFHVSSSLQDMRSFEYPLVKQWDVRSTHDVHLGTVESEGTAPRVLRDGVGLSSYLMMF